MSGIMGEKQTSSDSGGSTADEFVDKVEAVRQSTSSTPLHHVSETAAHTMASWEPVTPDDVVKLISNALNKSCQLDAAPTWLVKQYRGLLAPFISRLFNKSLATGCFPKLMKHADIIPIIKKDTQFSREGARPPGYTALESVLIVQQV